MEIFENGLLVHCGFEAEFKCHALKHQALFWITVSNSCPSDGVLRSVLGTMLLQVIVYAQEMTAAGDGRKESLLVKVEI